MYFVGVRVVTKVNENYRCSYSCVNAKNTREREAEDIVWFSFKLEESVFGWGLYDQALWLVSNNLGGFHL